MSAESSPTESSAVAGLLARTRFPVGGSLLASSCFSMARKLRRGASEKLATKVPPTKPIALTRKLTLTEAFTLEVNAPTRTFQP
jgi:hypothetical protein